MFNFNDRLQELRSTIIGLVLLAAATIIGFVWISVGLYHWLSICLGSVWGPIVLGLIYFLPIIIFAIIKTFIRPSTPPLPMLSDNTDTAAANLTKVFESLSGRSPFVMASAAVMAGFLATRFPAFLSVFMQILTVYTDDVAKRAAKTAAQHTDQPTDGINR